MSNAFQLPVPVAISGCGAVTRAYALPALKRLADKGLVRVDTLYDPDRRAAIEAGAGLAGAFIAPSYADLIRDDIGMVLLAGPPSVRFDQGRSALDAGIPVFCEKPLARTAAQAQQLIASSTEAGVNLGIGLVRRHFPATSVIHWLLSLGAVGTMERVDWFEGGIFSWPVGSPDYFSAASFGGVLADVGTHILDLARWWLGPLTIIDYQDDAMGGVEANCQIRIAAGPAAVNVRLSRDWPLANRVVISGREGKIVWNVENLTDVMIEFNGNARGGRLLASQSCESVDFVDCYARQVEDFIHSSLERRAPSVTADAGLEAAVLVESCLAQRHLMTMGWLSKDEQLSALRFAGSAK